MGVQLARVICGFSVTVVTVHFIHIKSIGVHTVQILALLMFEKLAKQKVVRCTKEQLII